MDNFSIDINCDVGEGLGNEASLFPYISSCNIACGGHAGDRDTMRGIIQLALEFGIEIGAHPSYPDREGFGRKSMRLSKEQLVFSLRTQLETFTEILQSEGGSLHHIKAHGALYNDLYIDQKLAELYLSALEPFLDGAILYCQQGSALAQLASGRQIPIWFEAFVDRRYLSDGSLVPRSHPKALIEEPKAALKQLLPMALQGKVLSLNGESIEINANTYCIHGDSPSALEILVYLTQELPNHQIRIGQ